MSAAPSLGLRLQRLFLTGLLTLLPLWLTWVVVKFVFVLLGDLSKPLVEPGLASIADGNPRTFGWLVEPWVQNAIALVDRRLLDQIGQRGDAAKHLFASRRVDRRPSAFGEEHQRDHLGDQDGGDQQHRKLAGKAAREQTQSQSDNSSTSAAKM